MTPSYEDFSPEIDLWCFQGWVFIHPDTATVVSPRHLENGSTTSLTPPEEGTKHVSCHPRIFLKPPHRISIPMFPERDVDTKSMPIGNNAFTEGNLHPMEHLKEAYQKPVRNGSYHSIPKMLASFEVEKVFVRDILFNIAPTSLACCLFSSI